MELCIDKNYFDVEALTITYERYEYPGEHYRYDTELYAEIRYNNREPDAEKFFKILVEAAKEEGRREVRKDLLATLGMDQFGKFKDFKR